MKKVLQRIAVLAIGSAWAMGVALLDYDIDPDYWEDDK